MKRESVESSNLASIGYDANQEILEIEFNHGGIYQFSHVPESIYKGLINASSKGQYFDRKIKKAGFVSSKVR